MFKTLSTLLFSIVIALFSFNVMAVEKTADGKYIIHTTTIDGKKYELLTNSFENSQHRKTLQMLEEAMAESNRLTLAYLKTSSPAWKDLMTLEMKANGQKFETIWKRIIIDRHYNKDVLNAYEKYATQRSENKDKMYAHFYKLSTNEPFKERVKMGQKVDKDHLLNDKAVIKYLRTLL